MSDITKDIVKTSKKLSKSSRKASKKLLKSGRKLVDDTLKGSQDVIKGSQDILQGTLKNTKKLGKGIYRDSKKVIENIGKGDLNKSLDSTGTLFKNTFSDLSNIFEQSLDSTIDNKYINLTLKILIAVYAAFIIPSLSKNTALFFDQLIVKIIMALVIVYLSSKDPSLGIIIALAYILTLQISNKYRLLEKSNNIEPTFNNEYFQGDELTSNNEEESNDILPDNITSTELNDYTNTNINSNAVEQTVDNNNTIRNTISENIDINNNHISNEELVNQNNNYNNNEVYGENHNHLVSDENNYQFGTNENNINTNIATEEISHNLNNIDFSNDNLINQNTNCQLNTENIDKYIPAPYEVGTLKNNLISPAEIQKSSNKVGKTHQNSCVKSLQNQSCIQGDFVNNIPIPFSNDVEYSSIQ